MSRLSDYTISTARLVSFSDGVFAIAVTLLVFNLKVPQVPSANVHQLLTRSLLAMLPNFITYVFTFMTVAVYWTFHHRMLNLVTHIDTPFLWLNILYLLMISFIPFPAALSGSYPNELVGFVFYLCTMIVISILAMLMLGYASYRSRLINKDNPTAIIKYLFFRQFTSCVVFLLSIPLAVFHLGLVKYYFFVLFPIHWLTRGYFRKYAGK